MQHYNIGKKTEVNPFEKVKHVTISSNISTGVNKLEALLHQKASSVTTVKINGMFTILFDIELLDFTTLLKWFEPFRGEFRVGSSTVHFRIEDEIMFCW